VLAQRAYSRDGEPILQARWPLGSVVKPFTVAAALERGVPADRVFSTANNLTFGNVEVRDHNPAPTRTMEETLVASSNLGSVHIGAAAGDAPLEATLRAAGLLVPSAASWTDADRALVATGQAVQGTPIELAHAYEALAGWRHEVVNAEVSSPIRGWLANAVRRGTGTRAAIDSAVVAGKTGTARMPDDPDAFVASFAGMVPADDPQFVVVVMAIDPGPQGYGGSVSAPAFAGLARFLTR
jgi:cell division protein FtsI (penicillin-binding protein 3)